MSNSLCIGGCGRPGAGRQHASYCDECRRVARNSANRAWRQNHPQHAADLKRRGNLRLKYGITPEQYDAMLEAQGGMCAACRAHGANRRGRLHVDHDHETGRVRALLCSNCNTALGKLHESPERIRALLRYAEEVCAR